ncbi:MAG: ABC transporter permease [Candidatus Dormibacteria bacterium]
MIQSSAQDNAAHKSAVASFRSALRAELMKLRYQRPTWVLIGFALLLLGLVMFSLAADSQIGSDLRRSPVLGLDQMLPGLQFVFAAGAGVVLLTSGSRLMAMEYTLGTIRVILARGTGRTQLVLAKLVACLLLGTGLLLAYIALSAAGMILVTLRLTGSLEAAARLPPSGWHQLALAVAAGAMSVLSCSVVGVTMGAVTRSLTGGMVLSVLFFPLDNALALVLRGLHHLDHLGVWRTLSAFLLGPSLNRLPALLTGQAAPGPPALPTPMFAMSAGEVVAVIAGWCLVLVALALLSSVRPDVLA